MMRLRAPLIKVNLWRNPSFVFKHECVMLCVIVYHRTNKMSIDWLTLYKHPLCSSFTDKMMKNLCYVIGFAHLVCCVSIDCQSQVLYAPTTLRIVTQQSNNLVNVSRTVLCCVDAGIHCFVFADCHGVYPSGYLAFSFASSLLSISQVLEDVKHFF